MVDKSEIKDYFEDKVELEESEPAKEDYVGMTSDEFEERYSEVKSIDYKRAMSLLTTVLTNRDGDVDILSFWEDKEGFNHTAFDLEMGSALEYLEHPNGGNGSLSEREVRYISQ